MFKSNTLLRNCLIKKGWIKTDKPQKGNPIFVKGLFFTMITVSNEVINNSIKVCSHTPDRCNGKFGLEYIEFYSPPN